MKGKVVHLQSLGWPVLFLIAGIATSFYDILSHSATALIAIVGSLILVSVLYAIRTESITPYLSYLIVLFLFFGTGWGITQLQKTQFRDYSTDHTLINYPAGTIHSITQYDKMDRIQVQIPSSHRWSVPHYFNVNLLDKNHDFHPGQIISLSTPLSPITSAPLPFTFPARAYWAQKNTSHEVFVRNASNIQVVRDRPDTYINTIRRKANSRIDQIYPDATHAGILKALLLGQKEGVSKNDKANFKKAGLMHILAVSGLHVGIISALLVLLLFPVRLIISNSWFHYFLLIAGLWSYAALTGMNTPVVRAVILVTFYLTAQKIDRQIDKWNIYFWAVLLVLVVHPIALFTVSFQLSFGAVAAIFLFYKSFQDLIIPLLGRNYFSGLVAVSLAAQVGISPLLLFHFQEISLVSTLSSFLVIPLLFPLILIASTSVLIPTSWDWLSTVLANLSEVLLRIITGISGELASWDISSQIWVLSSVTLIFLIISFILFGVYLELRRQISISQLLYSALGFAILAGLSEGVNIYLKRNQAVLVLYENMETPASDLFYRGICYTTVIEEPPPHIYKNRKKYYSKKTIILSEPDNWKHLVSTIGSSISPPKTFGFPEFFRNNNLKVFDYVQNTYNDLVLDAENRNEIFKNKGAFPPILTAFKPE